MDLNVLKKRLSSFRTEGGHLREVSNDVALELLHAWEQWTGPASGFYKAIGVDYRKVGSLIKKAKRLRREGYSIESEFIEISTDNLGGSNTTGLNCFIELAWDNNRVIRFSQVDTLMEFLNRVGSTEKQAA